MVAQPLGVELFPALEGHGLAAFQGLRGFALGMAGQVGANVGAELVAFDFDHQVFAVGAAQHKVGRVGVPAPVVAQVFGAQVGFAGVGQPASEPQAFNLVRVRLQQAQRPVQKFGFGVGVKVVAFVVKAALQRQCGMGRVLGGFIEVLVFFVEADAGGVNRLAVHFGAVKAVGLDQCYGYLDFVPGFFVLVALGFDLPTQRVDVML